MLKAAVKQPRSQVSPRFSPTCPTEREGEPRLAYESSSNFFDEREARAVDFLCFLR